MKNNNLLIVITSILFVFCLLISCFYLDLRKTIRHSSIIHNNITNINDIYERLYAGINSDNELLNVDSKLVSYNKESLEFKDVISPDSMYLILKYPAGYCDDCIDKICERIKIMKTGMSCIHIVVLVQAPSLRDMKIKVRNFKDEIPTYLLKANDLGLPLDESNVPYITFVNDGKTSKHTILVNSNQLEVLSAYLQTITEKYCDDEQSESDES